MKIHDLLTENRLDEKPMGFLKTLGNKAMSALGSSKASGKLETGQMANQLRKEYDTYLGRSGEEASADNLLAFLKSKNLPTDGAARALKAQAPQGAVAGAVKGLAKGAADIGKAAVAGAKAATAEPAAQADADTAAKPAAPAAKADAPQQKVEPTLEPKAAEPKPSFGKGTAMPTKVTPTPGAGTDPTPKQPAAKQPAPVQPAPTQPAGRAQGGGKVAGQVSTTPGATAKRANRVAAGQKKKADADRFNKAVVQPLMRKESLEEALSGSHIDAAIMAAAQDAAKQGISLPAAGGGGGMINKLGAVGAAAKAVGGATVDAAKAFDANFKAAYKGKAADPDAGVTGGEEPTGFSAGLTDESGVIPEDLMKKLNTLKNKQRQELLKLLG